MCRRYDSTTRRTQCSSCARSFPRLRLAIAALAARVGSLQASVARLNGLGRRVAKVAGLPDAEIAQEEETPEAIVVLDGMVSDEQRTPGNDAPAVPDLERTVEGVAQTLLRQND